MTCYYRCHRETDATIMSMLNTDILCLDCHEAEQDDPRYETARRAEAEAVLAGDFNFPGIGCSARKLSFAWAKMVVLRADTWADDPGREAPACQPGGRRPAGRTSTSWYGSSWTRTGTSGGT